MGANVRGKVEVVLQNNRLISIVNGTTAAPILPQTGTVTAGTGTYLDSVIIFPSVLTTVGSNQILLTDNLIGTVQLFPNAVAGTTTQINPLVYQIFIGATSQFGPWRITTGGNVIATAVVRLP